MSVEQIQSSAEVSRQEKLDTIATLQAQFGEPFAKAVGYMSDALLMGTTILKMQDFEPSINGLLQEQFMHRSVTQMTSLVCQLAEQAFSLTHAQGMEALEHAKSINQQVMASAEAALAVHRASVEMY